jgi:hypothetical protein
MSVPPIPPPLESLGSRPFSFYPAILNVEHNEWLFRRATWSEVLVLNTKSQVEIWVPRRFLGDLSRVDEPVMILGLRKELEYKAGSVWPSERRVIEMPRAVNDSTPRGTAPEPPGAPPRIVDIRMSTGAESRSVRLIVGVMVAGIVGCVLAVSLFREGPDSRRITYQPVLQSDLGLTGQDDFFAVTRKLGPPGEDRWLSETGEMQYRILRYPNRGLHVILMGSERNRALYIGALDDGYRPVDSVPLVRGGNSLALLRNRAEQLRNAEKRPRQ